MAKSITLIGAGIMSATLGVFLKKLMPDAQITIYERLDQVGAESSDAWNNAGTGHSAFCELNYTPESENGDIDISKALKISESFEISKQFWSYLITEGDLKNDDGSFINDIPHMSFVWGDGNVEFLRKRYISLTQYPIFADMLFSRDAEEMSVWMPLIMADRDTEQPIAATRMSIGTDVNFGAITRGMIQYLEVCEGVEVKLGHEIKDINRAGDGWEIEVKNLKTKEDTAKVFDFVFIGAGGGALKLLEKSEIPEARGYGGFPVGGQWLKCTNPEVVKHHQAKVYGKAEEGAPPMSVPHLDTRLLDGERSLLFGPYAGFSTKFLKNGSYLDLPLSLEVHNIWPMLSAGIHNVGLTKYLVEQVFQSPEDRFSALQKYYPSARSEDWELAIAGQRVQIIKKDKEEGGVLKFGTEIVTDSSLSLAALLGASPGASTSVGIMLDVLKKCFPNELKTDAWQKKLKSMIPSYGESLIKNGDLLRKVRKDTTNILGLETREEEWK